MYQASEMNLVVFAEYFQLADVTAPRHIHVWLHRNGMMVLMGYTGEEMFEKVFSCTDTAGGHRTE